MSAEQSVGKRMVREHYGYEDDEPLPDEKLAERIDAAVAAARAGERERAERIIEAEPELPGEPSEAMRAALAEDPVRVVRAAIRVTKRNLVAAIRARAESEGAKA